VVSLLHRRLQAPDIFVSLQKGIGKGILSAFQGAVQGLTGAEEGEIQESFDNITDNLNPVETFASVGSGIADGIVDGIQDSAGDVFNAIVGPINSAIETFNDALEVEIPEVTLAEGTPAEISVGGQTISPPDVPKLAEGGIVTEETFARIGEGGQPEAVVPLDKSDQFGDTYNIDVTVKGGEMSESRLARDLHAEFQAQDI